MTTWVRMMVQKIMYKERLKFNYVCMNLIYALEFELCMILIYALEFGLCMILVYAFTLRTLFKLLDYV